MTEEELAAGWVERFPDATTETGFGPLTVDVAPTDWVAAAEYARTGLGCAFFDWLTAVDELADGFSIVAHLASTRPEHGHHHLLLRTRIGRQAPRLATLTGVYAGASWHERETHEMFGVVFEGHPNLVPLLLPDGFEGHPLRKEFVLAARAAKNWPGAKEPGESDGAEPARAATSRRRLLPPGVPDPAEWGPRAAPDQPPPG